MDSLLVEACQTARARLLAARDAGGAWWTGALSDSALSTALAVSALVLSIGITYTLLGIRRNAEQLTRRLDETLRQVYSWMLGRLTTSVWSDVVTVLPYVLVSIAVIALFRRTLDVMAVGDLEASTLGIAPARVRLALICAATLGTAAVVSVSGLIGFVGIVIPHAVRMLIGPGHRLLLPVSLLAGAAFLVLADVVARTAMSPAELPIGVVTAAIGAPFFLFVLRRSRGQI